MNERDIEKRLVRRAKEKGWLCRKVKWIGCNGAPDRALMGPGFLLYLELKAPGEEPTAQQLKRHAELRASGQTVRVIDSIEGVEELFA